MTKPSMVQQIPYVTICSVERKPFYRRLMLVAPTDEKEQPTGRATEYRLAGVKEGEHYTTLRVYQGHSFPINFEHAADGSRPPVPHTENPMAIAGSLLDEWLGISEHSNQLPRGIGIIEGDIPTQEELNKLNGQKWSRMRTLVMKADQRIASGQSLDVLTQEDVDAAIEIGEVRDWANPSQSMAKKRCPNCASIISADAIGCSACGKSLPDWYEEEGYEDAEIQQEDPIVWAHIQKRRKRLANKEKKVTSKLG